MRRPHRDHFDRTSETTEGISNTFFSGAVTPEKRNLKPRFARACGGGALPRQDGAEPRHHTWGDSFRFHGVKAGQLSLPNGRRSGHISRRSLNFSVYRKFGIDQAISLSGAESRGERN